MKTIEIRYDAAPHLAQTVGPFLTEHSAEAWKNDFLKAVSALGWLEIENVTTMATQSGDGFITRLRDLESGHRMTVQMKGFDEPKPVELFTNDVMNLVRSLPLRIG